MIIIKKNCASFKRMAISGSETIFAGNRLVKDERGGGSDDDVRITILGIANRIRYLVLPKITAQRRLVMTKSHDLF